MTSSLVNILTERAPGLSFGNEIIRRERQILLHSSSDLNSGTSVLGQKRRWN